MTIRILLPLVLAAGAAATSPALGQVSESGEVAADLVDTGGQTVGRAIIRDAGNGVFIRVEAQGLPPGEHGMHLHQVAVCDSLGGFETAGDHIEGEGAAHGLLNPDGPHAGDLPNLFVDASGMGTVEAETIRVVFEGAHTSLLDADGSALVIHAHPDDHVSEDGGGSGARIACAEFKATAAEANGIAE